MDTVRVDAAMEYIEVKVNNGSIDPMWLQRNTDLYRGEKMNPRNAVKFRHMGSVLMKDDGFVGTMTNTPPADARFRPVVLHTHTVERMPILGLSSRIALGYVPEGTMDYYRARPDNKFEKAMELFMSKHDGLYRIYPVFTRDRGVDIRGQYVELDHFVGYFPIYSPAITKGEDGGEGQGKDAYEDDTQGFLFDLSI